MFRKMEMKLLPSGEVAFLNVELEPKIIKDILDRCDYEGSKIFVMKTAFNDVFRELGNLTSYLYDPDEIVDELEKKINTEFEDRYMRKTKELERLDRKQKVLDMIYTQVGNTLDNLEKGSDVNININVKDAESPKEEMSKEDNQEIIFSIDADEADKLLEKETDEK